MTGHENSIVGASCSDSADDPLLFVDCQVKKKPIKFLVDTGSAKTIIPFSYANDIELAPLRLSAANGSKIHTYGYSNVNLAFKKLPRAYDWKCVVVDVVTPLIGADFLKSAGLIVDVKRRRLLDPETKFYVNCEISEIRSNLLPVTVVSTDTPSEVGTLLGKYRQITTPMEATTKILHSTEHKIVTTGLPLFYKPRPLHGEKLDAVKKEFDNLLKLGIVRHSNSPWASPIHLVRKGDGWRICGDYRRVNTVTE